MLGTLDRAYVAAPETARYNGHARRYGRPIAPCHDPGGASIEVAARLSPFAMAAACVAVGRTSLFRHLARRVRDVMRGNGARVR